MNTRELFNIINLQDNDLGVQLDTALFVEEKLAAGININGIAYYLAKHACGMPVVDMLIKKYAADFNAILEGYIESRDGDLLQAYIESMFLKIASLKEARLKIYDFISMLAKHGQFGHAEGLYKRGILELDKDIFYISLMKGCAQGGYLKQLQQYKSKVTLAVDETLSLDNELVGIFSENRHINEAIQYSLEYFSFMQTNRLLKSLENKYGKIEVQRLIKPEFIEKFELRISPDEYLVANEETLSELMSKYDGEFSKNKEFRSVMEYLMHHLIVSRFLLPADVNDYLLPAILIFYKITKRELSSNNLKDIQKQVLIQAEKYLDLNVDLKVGGEDADFDVYIAYITAKITDLLEDGIFSKYKNMLQKYLKVFLAKYGLVVDNENIDHFARCVADFMKNKFNEFEDPSTVSLRELINEKNAGNLSAKRIEEINLEIRALMDIKKRKSRKKSVSPEMKLKDYIEKELFDEVYLSLNNNSEINFQEMLLLLHPIRFRSYQSIPLRRLDSLARLLSLQVKGQCLALTIFNGKLHIATNSVNSIEIKSELDLLIKSRVESLTKLLWNIQHVTGFDIEGAVESYLTTYYGNFSLGEEKRQYLLRDIRKLLRYFSDLNSFKDPIIHTKLSSQDGRAYHAEQTLVDDLKDFTSDVLFVGIEKLCCKNCHVHLSEFDKVIYRGCSGIGFGGLAFGQDYSQALPLRLQGDLLDQISASGASSASMRDSQISFASTLFSQSPYAGRMQSPMSISEPNASAQDKENISIKLLSPLKPNGVLQPSWTAVRLSGPMSVSAPDSGAIRIKSSEGIETRGSVFESRRFQ